MPSGRVHLACMIQNKTFLKLKTKNIERDGHSVLHDNQLVKKFASKGAKIIK